MTQLEKQLKNVGEADRTRMLPHTVRFTPRQTSRIQNLAEDHRISFAEACRRLIESGLKQVERR